MEISTSRCGLLIEDGAVWPQWTDIGKSDAMVRRAWNMTRATPLIRFYELPSERRRMLLRALLALTAASAAVAFLPFRTAIRFGSTPLKPRTGVTSDQCVWAVEAAGRRLPWRTMCIQKGLAVQRLLRADGVDAMLHYGARRNADSDELEAHVWVSVGGSTVIGGEEAPGFGEIAVFP